jgi:hypothetical protein
MLRAVTGALLGLVAAGSPTGIRDDPAASRVALAGPEILVAREQGGAAQLLALPRSGGPARTLLSVGSAEHGWWEQQTLSASDRRVAVIVEMERSPGRTVGWRVYSGSPAGPLEIVRETPDRGLEPSEPYLVDVDGDRVLLVEVSGLRESLRAQILEPAFGFVPIEWATDSYAPLAIAGGYAAVRARRPSRVAVVDLATGGEHAAIRLPRNLSEFGVDLAADGRMVASLPRGLVTARPGEAPATLAGTKGLIWPQFAGDAIVAMQDARYPVVLRADGSRESFGPPTRLVRSFAADADGVAWLANGCVRYAPPAAQAADPCPSTEIGFYLIADARLRGRHVRVPVICETAPAGTCRGTVLGRLGRRVVARGRFAVPVGRERWVRMRVTRRAVARFRRERGGSLIIDARMPDGRIGAGSDGSAELSVKVR